MLTNEGNNQKLTEREQEIRDFFVMAKIHEIRALTRDNREELFRCLKKIGIAEERTVLLGWLLDENPDIVIVPFALQEAIDKTRQQIIKTSLQKAYPPSNQQDKPQEQRKNPERILAYSELQKRFQKLNIDIFRILASWQRFYAQHFTPQHQHEKVKYRTGIPMITSSAMDALEKAFHEKKITHVMLDDARISDGKTIQQLNPGALTRFARIHDIESDEKAVELLDKTMITPPTLQIVGYKVDGTVVDPENYPASSKDTTSQNTFESHMGLGTFLRLHNYLKQHDPDALHILETYTLKGSGKISPRALQLNNRTESGRYLIYAPIQRRKKTYYCLEFGPGIDELSIHFETPIPIIGSTPKKLQDKQANLMPPQ